MEGLLPQPASTAPSNRSLHFHCSLAWASTFVRAYIIRISITCHLPTTSLFRSITTLRHALSGRPSVIHVIPDRVISAVLYHDPLTCPEHVQQARSACSFLRAYGGCRNFLCYRSVLANIHLGTGSIGVSAGDPRLNLTELQQCSTGSQMPDWQ
ncbi:hypothetical protein BDV96DRAFT_294331 [Lophiotrema nucula]|uniref:Uncharacterized protein n=1 Tax=Lophiotrema nucula TaxID=690887 RepID=A0A6A5YKY0_9PLEO|nr:hypothetical protein BDV96DRAFT_294331 [Lophiotrema nucula]